MWGGPGGLQEEDESETDAATREAEEEAGVKVTLGSEQPFYSSRWGGDGRYIRYFLATVPEDAEVTFPDREADSYLWVTYEEAKRLPLAFCYGEAIEKLHDENLF